MLTETFNRRLNVRDRASNDRGSIRPGRPRHCGELVNAGCRKGSGDRFLIFTKH